MPLSLRQGPALAVLASAMLAATLAAGDQPQPPPWTVDRNPTVTLGGEESDQASLLQVVVFATRLPDGSILVGDRGDFALKQYSPSGKLQKTFGRKGGGPGEVRFLGRMFRCGDLVYTYDIQEGHRISVFSLDGRFVRAFRFSVPAGQQTPYQSACNSSGRFVHIGWEDLRRAAKGGIFRSLVPVWFSAGDSSSHLVVDSVAGSERWVIVADGQLRGSRPLPLGKQPVLAYGRARAYVGTADRFEILSFEADGRPGSRVQRAEAPIPVSKDDIRADIDLTVANAGESRRAAIEKSYEDFTFPATLPAYTQLIVDSEDHLWVRSFPRGTGPTVQWSVFSPAGRLVGDVAVPRHLEVYEIGRDYILGRFLDPDEGIPEVRQYRLTRR